MSLLEKIDPPEGEAQIEPGKRLIRVGDDRGVSLAERLSSRLHRLPGGRRYTPSACAGFR